MPPLVARWKALRWNSLAKWGQDLDQACGTKPRHIWLPVMCNVYRVALIPNGVKRGDKTGACYLSGVHRSWLKRKHELLMHHTDPVALPTLTEWHQLLSQEPSCCKMKCISWRRPGLSGKVAFIYGESRLDMMLLKQASQFFPQWISVVAPPGNKSRFAAISDYIKGHLDLYQCAIHEAWHRNILTAEKMIHSTTILITRSANISNYVLMDECVIVGGDWDRCADRSRNQKDPKSRRPREHFPLFM